MRRVSSFFGFVLRHLVRVFMFALVFAIVGSVIGYFFSADFLWAGSFAGVLIGVCFAFIVPRNSPHDGADRGVHTATRRGHDAGGSSGSGGGF